MKINTTYLARILRGLAYLLMLMPSKQQDLLSSFRKGSLKSTTCSGPGHLVLWSNGRRVIQEVSEEEADVLLQCGTVEVFTITCIKDNKFTYYGFGIEVNDSEFEPDEEEIWGMILPILERDLK